MQSVTDPVPDDAAGVRESWTWFRMTGTAADLRAALRRLADAGWTVGDSPPLRGPFDSWTVAVRPPAPTTLPLSRLAAS